MGVIETEILQLVIGVPKAPGDTRSAEQGIVTFPLIIPNGSTGFTIKSGNRWQPGRPALKDQWNDSALIDGRSLAGVAVGNVRETIVLRAAADNRLILEARINTLSRFINQAREFFATFHQIEPVYLEWAALGGKGSQYALIYTIDLNVTYDDYGDGDDAKADVTLVIEREPAWRGIPPGVSPRAWTYYTRGLLPGAGYDYADLDLATSGALVEDTIHNGNEYALAVDDGDYPSVTQNWIDIPAALIPGDAPALVSIFMDPNAGAIVHRILISRITKPGTLTARDSAVRGRPLTINATDCTTTGTKTNDTTFGKRNASTGTQQIVVFTAGAKFLSEVPDHTLYRLAQNAMRGHYNVFARGYFSDSTPPDDGVAMSLAMRMYGDNVAVTPTVYAGGANLNSNSPFAVHLGQLTIPLGKRAQIGLRDGLQIDDNAKMDTYAAGNEELEFNLAVTVATGETFNLIDLIFMPFDEPALMLDNHVHSTMNTYNVFVDDTGFLAHGAPGTFAMNYYVSDLRTDFLLPAPQGVDLVLAPQIDNRLAFLFTSFPTDGVGGGSLEINASFTVRVDIVPRWYGVRDS